MLEDFTKVTLWLGGAVKTWETAKQFSKKLNDSRCHLIRLILVSLYKVLSFWAYEDSVVDLTLSAFIY